MSAATGLSIAKRGPSRLRVTKMLSAPVCGVDRRNEIVAPLLAPCFRNDIETGITPQEQSGSGMPKREAFRRGASPFEPRCLSTDSGEIKTERMPATRKPKSRYGDISARVCQRSCANV